MRALTTLGSLSLAVACLAFGSAPASAQSALTGSIAGVVRDTSGAVLPGVTVEAASPALIERSRTAITDDQGVYKIVSLASGTYTVTFSLPGFSTVRREGIELTTGFTASVNADMRVGAVEETVTVSGAAPVVDTQNVMTQNVFTRQALDQLPNTKTIKGFAPLIPGAIVGATQQDVGGNTGEANTSIGVHGNRGADMVPQLNGLRSINLMGASGGTRSFAMNAAAVQEVTFETSGISAESETGGVQMNVVPKEGGNQFTGYLGTNFTNHDLQGSNVNDELIARGFPRPLGIRQIYDFNPALGGPVKKDKLWFYAALRWWGNSDQKNTPGDYFNKSQGTPFYTADTSRPFYQENPRRSLAGRVTWQISQKSKMTFGEDYQTSCNCPQVVTGTVAPEGLGFHRYHPNSFTDMGWTYPATNRLLIEAGVAYFRGRTSYNPVTGVSPTDIGITELSSGVRFGSRATAANVDGGYGTIKQDHTNQRLAMSYITGSHAFKTGLFALEGVRHHYSVINADRAYTVRNGLPTQLTLFATPAVNDNKIVNLGIYVQDQWTIRRVTLNLGVRYDHLDAWDPAQSVGAGSFVGARTYAEASDLPNFSDLSPRLGAAYDLFGNGKTALKGSIGRYVTNIGPAFAQAYHPAVLQASSVNRTWNDLNGNFVPDCNLTQSAANLECGAFSDLTFGQPGVTSTHPADDILTGFGNRGYNWQAAVSMQHELRPGVGINVGYFRTWYNNFTVTDNQAVGPADFSPYCITSPTDPRLPSDVSGSQVCGLYDINPSKFGQVNNLVTQASHYGKQTEVYNGFDLTMNARFGGGIMLTGGLSTGQTVTDNCAVLMDSPQQRFCHVISPFEGQTQFKLSGVYTLPWDLQTSVTYQNLAGIPITSSYVATNAQVAPSLGRNLGACGSNAVCTATVTVDLIEPNTSFETRIKQADIRFSKVFRMGKTRLQGQFDIYNLFNASPVLALNNRYGASWLQPTQILAARLFKFGAQLNF